MQGEADEPTKMSYILWIMGSLQVDSISSRIGPKACSAARVEPPLSGGGAF